MKTKLLFGLALLFIALLAFTPAKSIAQSVDSPAQATRPQQDRSSNINQQTDQRVQAIVTGVDQPDGCLRIRQESSSSSEIIGCANMDEKLQLSGNYSRDGRWAELADKGWVFAAQIDAPNKPKVQRQARRSYETYDTEDSYTVESDSSLWREPAGFSYGTDTGVVYGGGSYSYRPRMGVGFGPGWGQYQGGGFGPWGQHRGGGHHRRN